jgi:methylenetetrahydrofolate reductase (NADPH)
VRDRRFSFELFPPKTDAGRKRFSTTVRELAELGPSFMSVTFGAGGSTREGSFETCAEVLRTTHVPVTPHLSCIGSTHEQLREQLDMYRAIGVRRVMALRGDVPEGEPELPRAFNYANELVGFIRQRGDFHISVACYPEFHPESQSPEADVEAFVRKARAGADEAISQYFYSNDAYYRFVEWVQKLGVEIPIVPGLMPIVDYAQVVRFSSFCGADIPAFIRKRMEQFDGDPQSQKELGIELAIRQAEQLLASGAPGIHFYTLNRSEPTARIWKALGLSPAAPAASPRATHAQAEGSA